MYELALSDSGRSAADSGNTIGGLTFGSAGSGKHTTGGGIPPWLIAVGLGLLAFVVIKGAK